MNRRKSNKESGGSFLRLLGWTIVLSVVFSAGLITGQRILREESMPPLVSVASNPSEESEAGGVDGEASPPKDSAKETIFSFYDRLSKGIPANTASEPNPVDSQPAIESQLVKSQDDEPSPAEESPAESAAEVPEEEPPSSPPEERRKVAAESEETSDGRETTDGPNDEATAEPPSAAKYTLQVSAHPNLEDAKAELKQLRNRGLDPHLVTAEIPSKGEFYRVRLGKFPSMEKARTVQGEVEGAHDLETFVTPL